MSSTQEWYWKITSQIKSWGENQTNEQTETKTNQTNKWTWTVSLMILVFCTVVIILFLISPVFFFAHFEFLYGWIWKVCITLSLSLCIHYYICAIKYWYLIDFLPVEDHGYKYACLIISIIGKHAMVLIQWVL